MSVRETDIPARLDRLPWSRFHWHVLVALGITWILDGLEVTLVGAISGALQASPTLHLSDAEIGGSASLYLTGAVAGALFFGWLTDRLGRKKLFFVTLGVYLLGTALSAASWDFVSFAVFRAVTGAGIGGEYAAINSAIQELIPARFRGRTDLLVNGSFWLGGALGALGAVLLLAPGVLPADMGWRVAFGIGAVLGLAILALRSFLPESPRWLMTHGRLDEANEIVCEIEATIVEQTREPLPPVGDLRLPVRSKETHFGPLDLARVLFGLYPRRAVLGLVLMAAQAFFFNAIFFTYALVLGKFYAIPSDRIGLYILPFAAGNFLGPLILGRFFDTIGRRRMISLTYAASGLLLALTAWLFVAGIVGAAGQTLAWTIVFFFASTAASSAYLTVSESFPLEVRALAIALFYALGTAVGGIAGPWVLSGLIGTGTRDGIAWGYCFGAVLMVIGAGVELWLGIDAEGKSLETVAVPLSSGKG